jgi:hypothetical protein
MRLVLCYFYLTLKLLRIEDFIEAHGMPLIKKTRRNDLHEGEYE